jgi:hypothetical protein
MTCGRLYLSDTLLERLAPHFEHMPPELRQLIQQEDAVVGQRDLSRHRHLAAADQAGIREGVVRGATRSGGHQGGALAGEAGDAREARGLEGLGEGQRRQDGGEPPRQPRRARPRRAQQQDVGVRTPASDLVLRL